MPKSRRWRYWNTLPDEIPSDPSTLTDVKKKELLEKWSSGVQTKSTQKPEEKLANIKDLPKINVQVQEWAMDRIKEAANHYVEGEWLSGISISATISEFLTYEKLERYICEKGIGEVIQRSKQLGNQDGRLKILRDLRIISEENYQRLDEIRNIRNTYIHLLKIDFADFDIKQKCRKSVSNLINVLVDETRQPKNQKA